MINETNMMHGFDYLDDNVDGWLMSEKMEGCRAYWDGSVVWSRGGMVINIPTAMRDALPKGVSLDGEIHAGRGGYEVVRQAVQYNHWTDDCQFSAFDVPHMRGYPFHIRYEVLSRELPIIGVINHVLHFPCSCIDVAVELMQTIQIDGGEGVMLRDPDALYVCKRVESVLKLKDAPNSRSGKIRGIRG